MHGYAYMQMNFGVYAHGYLLLALQYVVCTLIYVTCMMHHGRAHVFVQTYVLYTKYEFIKHICAIFKFILYFVHIFVHL